MTVTNEMIKGTDLENASLEEIVKAAKGELKGGGGETDERKEGQELRWNDYGEAEEGKNNLLSSLMVQISLSSRKTMPPPRVFSS